ncbi:hypothetical protein CAUPRSCDRAFT_11738 [Caulochytrium protostelioides]|uniref:Uncharacterized protein n=1 Tax=Caulochytrium protostelioides TaxID=1555241 RepID=A0A4P9WW67_9FUNG|nr:hypothetical protein CAUPRSCDRAFT_11738 [Caulochytrium protostelioides]
MLMLTGGLPFLLRTFFLCVAVTALPPGDQGRQRSPENYFRLTDQNPLLYDPTELAADSFDNDFIHPYPSYAGHSFQADPAAPWGGPQAESLPLESNHENQLQGLPALSNLPDLDSYFPLSLNAFPDSLHGDGGGMEASRIAGAQPFSPNHLALPAEYHTGPGFTDPNPSSFFQPLPAGDGNGVRGPVAVHALPANFQITSAISLVRMGPQYVPHAGRVPDDDLKDVDWFTIARNRATLHEFLQKQEMMYRQHLTKVLAHLSQPDNDLYSMIERFATPLRETDVKAAQILDALSMRPHPNGSPTAEYEQMITLATQSSLTRRYAALELPLPQHLAEALEYRNERYPLSAFQNLPSPDRVLVWFKSNGDVSRMKLREASAELIQLFSNPPFSTANLPWKTMPSTAVADPSQVDLPRLFSAFTPSPSRVVPKAQVRKSRGAESLRSMLPRPRP